MKFRYLFLLAIIFIFTAIGCKKDVPVQEQIDNYLKENNLTAQSTGDGLYYIIDVPGSIEKPTISNKVTVHYEGKLINGNKFDSSYDRNMAAEFPLSDVIKGWQIGIPLFGKGGKGKLIVPPFLAYGSQSRPKIPANSVLIFDVEVIDFK